MALQEQDFPKCFENVNEKRGPAKKKASRATPVMASAFALRQAEF